MHQTQRNVVEQEYTTQQNGYSGDNWITRPSQ